jgi:hypothetical protein
MAFKVHSYRLPDAYDAEIKRIADDLKVSEGYVIQVALYGSGNERLPPPAMRDPSGKTQKIELEEKHEGTANQSETIL